MTGVDRPRPMRHLLRMRALALVIIGGVTAAIVVGLWAERPRPLLLPLLAAYVLFNFGFVVTMARASSMT